MGDGDWWIALAMDWRTSLDVVAVKVWVWEGDVINLVH
jgi:hypothetical protein